MRLFQFLILEIVLFLSSVGCGECEIEDWTSPQFYTLIANPEMVFVDSLGNTLTLNLHKIETKSCGLGTGDTRTNWCEASCEYDVAQFDSEPDQGFGFYQTLEQALLFHNGFSAFSGYQDTVLVLQGRQFDDCRIQYSDTIWSGITWAFDSNYGIVLMEVEGQFRWERVLTP